MTNFLKHLLLPALLISLATTCAAENYALVMGIANYPDPVDEFGAVLTDDAGVPLSNRLSGAVNDARAINRLLVSKYAFRAPNVQLLLDEKATGDAFFAAWKSLAYRLKPKDKLVFYFSGHGTTVPSSQEADGKDEMIMLGDETLVSDNFFGDVAKALAEMGVDATFVFDSCFSGGMARDVFELGGKSVRPVAKFVPRRKLSKPRKLDVTSLQGAMLTSKGKKRAGSYAFLFASRESEPATDLQFKDPTVPSHGLLTLLLTDLLDQLPKAPIIDVMAAVGSEIKKTKFEQRPMYKFSTPSRGRRPFTG
jgi:hypothetical protein